MNKDNKKSPVDITMKVEYCSLCPLASVRGPIWSRELEQEVFDVHCTKLNKPVYEDLHWTECASACKSHTGCDVPPRECPFHINPENMEGRGIIAEKYATVKEDVIGRRWAEADEKDALVGCIQELEPGTRIKVIVLKQN